MTHSEVCRATAEPPFGPYRFAEVVLPKRPGYWDGVPVTRVNPRELCETLRRQGAAVI